ncbi:MAG: response regulator transcription factor [Chloroflexota bacterium]|nr:response regulator transcription factor [Chloroflexota bacterium]
MTKTPTARVTGIAGEDRALVAQTLREAGFRVREGDKLPDKSLSRSRQCPDLLVFLTAGTDQAQQCASRCRACYPALPVLSVVREYDTDGAAAVLEAGADDVLALSRVVPQLGARARALHRRYGLQDTTQKVPLVAGELKIDFGLHRVWVQDREVLLSPTEFRLLRKLSMHIGRVVPHEDILIAVWGEPKPEALRALRVYIRHLRQKVQSAGAAIRIIARPGIGYMLSAPV